MSIDKIRLPLFIHQSLFRNKLVGNTAHTTAENTYSAEAIKFLGGNEKNIIFIVKDSEHAFLNDTSMKFLQGLLAACKLTMADIAFINIHHYPSVSYEDINDQLQASKLLLFGIAASELSLPFEIPAFQVQHFHKQQYMFGPSLDVLQNDVVLKKQLWICLQKMFIIK